jgi:hypothetical protein
MLLETGLLILPSAFCLPWRAEAIRRRRLYPVFSPSTI